MAGKDIPYYYFSVLVKNGPKVKSKSCVIFKSKFFFVYSIKLLLLVIFNCYSGYSL